MTKSVKNPYIGTRLDLMSVNQRILNYSFIIPSENVRSSFRKSSIYNLVQMVIIGVDMAIFVLQILGLYFYWGNLDHTVENITIITISFILGNVPAIITIFDQRKLLELIEAIETESLISLKRINENERYMNILNEAKKFSTDVLNITTIGLISNTIFWSFSPLFMYLWDRQHEKTTDPESLKEKFEYLVFIMYIPYDVNDPLIYSVVYLIQVIALATSIIFMFGYLSLYMNLFIYLIVQFRIVTEALHQIDDLNDEIDYTGLKNIENKRQGMSDVFTVIPDENHEENKVSEDCGTGSGIKEAEDPAYVLLVECVKLHQLAIEFADKVTDVTRRNMCVAVLFGTVLLVTHTFHLSLRWTIKSFTALSTTLFILYILTWFGQDIIEGNENVGIAAYNCRWYDRSTKYKRLMLLLQVRSQKTLEMTLGKLFPLKLELLSLMVRTAYKFYTILLEMKES